MTSLLSFYTFFCEESRLCRLLAARSIFPHICHKGVEFPPRFLELAQFRPQNFIYTVLPQLPLRFFLLALRVFFFSPPRAECDAKS